MNGKERFASVILIVTLAIGIGAGVFDQEGTDDFVSEAGNVRAADSRAGLGVTYRRLDINAASETELMILPGIGPKKAKAIVDWRNSNGPFRSVGELTSVHGIGPKTLEGIEEYVFADAEREPSGD